jgi:hypothetical protein
LRGVALLLLGSQARTHLDVVTPPVAIAAVQLHHVLRRGDDEVAVDIGRGVFKAPWEPTIVHPVLEIDLDGFTPHGYVQLNRAVLVLFHLISLV